LIMAKIFKWSYHYSSASVLLRDHFQNLVSRHFMVVSAISCAMTSNFHHSVWGPWHVFVFLWISIQCHLAIFKFVRPHGHFLAAENVHSIACDESVTCSFYLQESDHHMDLKPRIIFNHTGL
jgi:hypothetical protein